jgi:hypothetical protein
MKRYAHLSTWLTILTVINIFGAILAELVLVAVVFPGAEGERKGGKEGLDGFNAAQWFAEHAKLCVFVGGTILIAYAYTISQAILEFVKCIRDTAQNTERVKATADTLVGAVNRVAHDVEEVKQSLTAS